MTGYVQELFFFHELFQFFHTVLFSRIITLLLLHEIFDFFSIRAKLNHSLVRLTHGLKRRLHTRIQTGDLYITWLKSYNLTNLQLHAELLSKKNIYKFTVSYKPSQSELSSDINVGGYQRTTFMIGRVFFLLTPTLPPPPPPFRVHLIAWRIRSSLLTKRVTDSSKNSAIHHFSKFGLALVLGGTPVSKGRSTRYTL